MAFRVRELKINETKYVSIVDGPKYSKEARAKGQKLIAYAGQIFLQHEVEEGHRASEWSPPHYIESFQLKKVGRVWRVINEDPGAMAVEFGVHPGGGETLALGYAPMRRALDALEAEGRL